MADRLPVAALAFTATASVRDNVARIRTAIDDAARAGVRLLAVPECALLGYPSAARADLAGVSWCEVADGEDALGEYARARDLALVLGTAGPVADGSGISNDAVASGRWVRPALRQGGGWVRYRKRHLTPTDVAHFVPGDSVAVFAIEDWRIGLAICFDVRFPRLWAEFAEAGCDAVVAIGHMAGPDPDPGTKSRLIPAMLATRAAEWVTPVLFANTAAPDRYFDSAAWDGRGVCTASCAEGLWCTEWQRREALDPWYRELHRRALAAWRGEETADDTPSRVL